MLALDLDEPGPQACAILKRLLIATLRYEVALRRIPNLRGLVEVPLIRSPSRAACTARLSTIHSTASRSVTPGRR